MVLPAGVDHNLRHRGGIDVGHVDAGGGHETAAHRVSEDLIGVDILALGLLHALHRADKVARDGLQVDRLCGLVLAFAGRVEAVDGVAHQFGLAQQRADQGFGLLLRRGRGQLRRGAAQKLLLALAEALVHGQRDMLGVPGAVLIEAVTDEVKLPARAALVRNRPGVGARGFQQVDHIVFHLSEPRFRFHIGAAV